MRPLAAASLVALLALAGCGDEDPVPASGGTVSLRLDEYRLTPPAVEVQGPRVKIVARDIGRLTHNVKVFSTTEFDSEDKPIQVGGTNTAHPGETVETTLELEPGEYRMACSIANHDDLGAHARLIVRGRS